MSNIVMVNSHFPVIVICGLLLILSDQFLVRTKVSLTQKTPPAGGFGFLSTQYIYIFLYIFNLSEFVFCCAFSNTESADDLYHQTLFIDLYLLSQRYLHFLVLIFIQQFIRHAVQIYDLCFTFMGQQAVSQLGDNFVKDRNNQRTCTLSCFRFLTCRKLTNVLKSHVHLDLEMDEGDFVILENLLVGILGTIERFGDPSSVFTCQIQSHV